MKDFLCIIVSDTSGEELDSFQLAAGDDLFARLQAVKRFEEKAKYIPRFKDINKSIPWSVDCCEI